MYDWAEINVACGPEEVAHFLLRAKIWSSCEDGSLQLCDPKQVARPLLKTYYRALTGNGVNAQQYTYATMLEHVSIGLLASAAKLVDRLEELRLEHGLGPTPFGAPRWILESLRTNLSLLNFVYPETQKKAKRKNGVATMQNKEA